MVLPPGTISARWIPGCFSFGVRGSQLSRQPAATVDSDVLLVWPPGLQAGEEERELPILRRMARGWESKNIEAQQEEASRRRPSGRPRTAEELARVDRRRALELARTRAVGDLRRATAPAHRHMLEQAIASLDEQLAGLD
jgi:hypothetical protein